MPRPKESGSASQSTTTQNAESLPVAISSLALREGTLSIVKSLPEGGRQVSRWEHINLELSDISPTTASRFDLSLGLGGNPKNKIRLSGTFGPLNLQAMDKAALDASSSCPKSQLRSLSSRLKLLQPGIGLER
jgi:hypothetical protein